LSYVRFYPIHYIKIKKASKEETKMARKKYYGVAGANGYGVYDKYGRVLDSRPFITKFTIKSFRDFSEAKAFAVNTYEEFQHDEIGSYYIENLDEKNWFYRRKPIEKAGVQDAMGDGSKQSIRPFVVGA